MAVVAGVTEEESLSLDGRAGVSFGGGGGGVGTGAQKTMWKFVSFSVPFVDVPADRTLTFSIV